jgi:hypothetical protein
VNAFIPIDVTLLGMFTEVRWEQDWKAPKPIDVTPLGIMMDVKEDVELNEKLPMAAVGYPPSVEGMVIAPPAPEYAVMLAFPLLTE